MEISAATFAANQVTQLSESTGSFAVAAFALNKAQGSAESSILPLIEKLPAIGGYSAQGISTIPAQSGSQLNLKA